MTDIKKAPLSKGTIIKCPGCDQHLFKITRDLAFGDQVRADLMEPLNPKIPAPKDGESMDCPFCGHAYGRGGISIELHTEEGWK